MVGRINKGRLVSTIAGWLSISSFLLSFNACSKYESAILNLVPLDSCAVVVVDWAALRNDDDLRRLFKGEQFETVLQRIALDSSSLKTMAVFSAMNTQRKAGMLLRGSFDKQSQISALKARGWQEESLEGRKVYVNKDDYAAFPQSNTIFAGTRDAAVAVFRSLNNRQESFAASSSYKRISAGMTAQNIPVRAFLIIPQGTLDMANAALEATSLALSLFDLGGVGALLKQITIASGFGLSIGRASNQSYPIEMRILMRDETAAALVSGSLNLMKGLSKAAPNSRDDEALQALHSMSITRVREVLSVKMRISQAALSPPSGH